MSNLYNWFIDAGINATAASWGTVILVIILVISFVGMVKCLLFPKK